MGLATEPTEASFQEWLKAHTLSPEKKAEIRAIVRAQNAALGIPDEPLDMTAEERLDRQERNGVNPADRIFQKELMMMRYGNCDEDS